MTKFVSVAACVLLLAACAPQESTKAPEVTSNTSAWAPYVLSHSGDSVPAMSPIRVRFSSPVVSDEAVDRPTTGVARIFPPIKFDAVFVRNDELHLIPAEPLAAGQAYVVEVNPFALANVELDESLRFSVVPRAQTFDISFDGMAPSRPGEMDLTGVVSTGDPATARTIARVLNASQSGRTLSVNWDHEPTLRSHRFSISGIQQDDNATSLTVAWDGAAIGAKVEGDVEIKVPARNDFLVTGVNVRADLRQFVDVSFSSPLAVDQNLAGLVRLGEQEVVPQVHGNSLRLYLPDGLIGEVGLHVDAAVKSNTGRSLGTAYNRLINIKRIGPGVRFVGRGVILPGQDGMTVPFEAVNVGSVTVTAMQVYRDNIGQFLQMNALSGDQDMRKVGRYLWRKQIALDELPKDRWKRYLLDVTDLVKGAAGALYVLELEIDRDQVLFECADSSPVAHPARPLENWEAPYEVQPSGWDGIASLYQAESAPYADRNDPCSPAYYRYSHEKELRSDRNLLASNIGLLAKQGADDTLIVAATWLPSAAKLRGVDIEVFNFQQQRIGRGTTDNNGLLTLKLDGTPFYLIAAKSEERGYLKLAINSALPISHFDVGGVSVQEGVKGFIYGERDVWRPGDTMHLTFVVDDRFNTLPQKHPASLDLFDARGEKVASITNTEPVGRFYAFEIPTSEDAPTGQWRAVARLGGKAFSKQVRVETIVPNRLSVTFDLEPEVLRASSFPLQGSLRAQWLSGATAPELKADMQVSLRSKSAQFGRYQDFVFDDPVRRFSGDAQQVFEQKLDRDGRLTFPLDLKLEQAAPGMLRAAFTTRVFEPGGQFSTQMRSFDFHPWSNYVGIRAPKGDQVRNMLLTDEDHVVRIATLDNHGKAVALKNVEVSLFKMEWRWWWDRSGESLARYASGAGHLALQRDVINTDEDGLAEWKLRINYPEWGRYLLRACDLDGGHCTGQIVYIDWPGWAGRSQEGSGEGAAMLSLTPDKPRYLVGETAIIQLPNSEGGRALVSVENGSRVIRHFWQEMEEGKTSFTVPVLPQMSPNAYVSVTMVQSHAGRGNDLPLRLFGVVPLLVEDPDTRLAPTIAVPAEVRPRRPFAIKVAEEAGRPMTYTIAVVDEGLLGITNFRTPSLHDAFFKREALGVKTWDLFDEVVGSYSGSLQRLLSIGGSDDIDESDDTSRRRFPPVVEVRGPFQLEAGATREHTFSLPQYLGAVRAMVVAGDNGRYGSADQGVYVRDPVSLLSTLPRSLAPGEDFRVPVSVFVQDDQVRNVDIRLIEDPLFDVSNGTATLEFDGVGEDIATMQMSVGDQTGNGRIRIEARGGEHLASEETFIDVRSPNPPSVEQANAIIEPGENWRHDFVPHGIDGSNTAQLEVSRVPALNLLGRLDYLIEYPHGCAEQITSAAFAQMNLLGILAMSESKRERVAHNVQHVIDSLRRYQRPSGAFASWSDARNVHGWTSVYAGHFLLEAEQAGYAVPSGMLDRWKYYESLQARTNTGDTGSGQLVQAYRLYVLARAGQPEVGAMNRLRERSQLDTRARWQLAAAYQAVGLADVAFDLVGRLASDDVMKYDVPDETFGSALRDKAMMLPVISGLGRVEVAEKLAKEIADQLGADHWLGTQTVSWALRALAQHFQVDIRGGSLQFAWSQESHGSQPATISVKSKSLVSANQLQPSKSALKVQNLGDHPLYISLVNRGISATGLKAARQGLDIRTKFVDRSGEPVNVAKLPQGIDVDMIIEVINTSVRRQEQLALMQKLPSGWQVSSEQPEDTSVQTSLEFQDVRDDQILSYFSLDAGEKITLKRTVNATFSGRFYLPAWQVEHMYDDSVFARNEGRWVEVIVR